MGWVGGTRTRTETELKLYYWDCPFGWTWTAPVFLGLISQGMWNTIFTSVAHVSYLPKTRIRRGCLSVCRSFFSTTVDTLYFWFTSSIIIQENRTFSMEHHTNKTWQRTITAAMLIAGLGHNKEIISMWLFWNRRQSNTELCHGKKKCY